MDAHTILDEKDAEVVKSLSMSDNFKLSMISFRLIYSVIKEWQDDAMFRTNLQGNAEMRWAIESRSLVLEACRALVENARRRVGLGTTTVPVIPVDKGHVFGFEDDIKVKLSNDEWVTPNQVKPVSGESGQIILVSA